MEELANGGVVLWRSCPKIPALSEIDQTVIPCQVSAF